MGRSPFAPKEFSPQARTSRRRSTRIDFITPVILSGRDATGQAFREETQTSIVNLHGAKVRTNYVIMVGMIVTLEVVRTGQVGKAVCVQVYEPAAGETIHQIAVQLVQPGNIWGVENPPPDWDAVEAELGGARQPAAKAADPKASVITMRSALEAPAAPALAASRGDVDALFAELEKRSARLMDSVLDILRIQADAAVRNSLQEVERRIESLVTTGGTRLQERAEQVGAELEMTLETVRTEAMGEVVREALEGFQQRLETLSKDAELGITRRADQAMKDFEAGLNDFEKRQETLKAEGDARIKRSSETATAEFEAGLQSAQLRQATLAADAEAKISHLAEMALADFDAALQTFRADVGDELDACREEVVKSTEQALRSRLAALLSTIIMPPAVEPTSTPADSKTKK